MLTTLLDPSRYHFSVLSVPPVAVGLGILLLGLATLVRERGSTVSRLFALMTSAVSLWLLAITLVYAAPDEQTALLWVKIEHVGICFIPPAIFHLALTVMHTYQRYRKWAWVGWSVAVMFALVTVTTDLIVRDLYHYSWGYFPRYSWTNVPFLVFFSVTLWASLRQYWHEYRSGAVGTTKYRRARAFLIAFGLGYLASIDYLPAYGVAIYPFGYIPILAFLLCSARAIRRYHLVDITPAFAANEIINTMSEAVLVLDQESIVRLVNPAAGNLFRLAIDDLLGKPVAAVIEGVVLPSPGEIEQRGGIIRTRESVYRTSSGETKMLSISASTMRDPARGLIAIVCIIRDITERKEAEERVQREAARSEALLRVASRLNAQLDLDAVLNAVCEETTRALNVPFSTVSLYNSHRKEYYLAASYGLPDKYVKRLRPEPMRRTYESVRLFGPIDVVPDIKAIEDLPNAAVYAALDIHTAVAAHMWRENELVGRLNIGVVGGQRHFSRDELDLLQGLADQAAQATANARLYEQAQRRLRQVESLRAIDAAIMRNPTLDLTLDVLLEQIVSQLEVDAAGVLLLDPYQETLNYAAGRGFRSGDIDLRVPIRLSFAGQAALEQRVISVPDLQEAQYANRRNGFLAREGFVSYFAVPLIAKGQVKGVLEIIHRTPLSPEPEWLYFMETLGGQAALAIDNATLFTETRRQSARLATLNVIIANAAGATNLSQLSEIALEHVLRALDLSHGAIRVVGRDTVAGFQADAEAGQNPLLYLAQREAHPLVVEDWQNADEVTAAGLMRQAMQRWGIRASLTVPVVADGQRLGGLSVAAAGARYWTQEEIELVKAVGQQLGAAAERLRLLEQIQLHARQVQQIMDTVPEGLLLLDRQRRVLLANPAATRYLSLLGHDLHAGRETANAELTSLGNKALDVLLAPLPQNAAAHEISGGAPERHTFEVIARPMQAIAGEDGSVLVLRDVTVERQITERAQQQDRLAAVGQLAAGIAHDFNNIMMVISLYVQMIERASQLGEKERDRLNTIRQQAIHATNLIEQILDFSRRSMLARRPVELLPFLEKFLQLLQRALPENIRIDFENEPGEHIVKADETRLQQVLMNLAVNARDAMPHGGSLRISLSVVTVQPNAPAPLPEMEPGCWLALVVADTGSGIPPQTLPRLFEPFFTTKEPGSGTGLGLAQVYGIIKQHEGHIVVQSKVGKGTTFTIYLPAVSLSDEVDDDDDEPLEMARGTETVLVVEDDNATRGAMENILETQGYHVLAAENGRRAMEIFDRRQGRVDLVLSDMVMPEMGGVDLYKSLKERKPDVKMIVITGYPLENEGQMLLQQGIISWLSKPVSMEQIVSKVRSALDREVMLAP